MADEEQKSLPYIQETVLKKRKNNEEWAIKRREQLEQRKQRGKENQKLVFKRAEQYIKEHRNKELDLVTMKQRGKQMRRRSSSVVPKSKLLFIIRTCGTNDMHPKTRKILHYLRLKRILAGVFVKANDRIMDMLRRVEPYVTYGYPDLRSVRDLVNKRGCGKIDGQKVPLTDNNIVEQALGKYGILNIEGIVSEITTVGLHFKEVVSFLCPFQFNKPKEGLQGRKKLYNDGGDAGNREDHISELILALT